MFRIIKFQSAQTSIASGAQTVYKGKRNEEHEETCLYVRYGGVQGAGPVDEPLASVNHPLIVHTDEGFLHRVGQLLIHGKARSIPVQRGPQLLQLVVNTVSLPTKEYNHLLFPVQVDF